ncbi:Hypothetical predicted protein [Cloeon dipterum]|uniref:Minor histocompatibility antigen H13 n=1 Tax=Cloeon dipterum TaxID=197152 RepID=A0A8S1DL90_9INSE|nr:Hypothetical predicted protein [Cloeon dipterum]
MRQFVSKSEPVAPSEARGVNNRQTSCCQKQQCECGERKKARGMAESDLLSSSSLQENVSATASSPSARVPATFEGAAVAYGSLVLMALLPIFFGAFRSVKHHKEQRESGETPDIMSHRDAALFPIIASAALFGLYIFFQIFSKEYINLLLTGYFFFLGVLALCHLLSPIISSLVPAAIPNVHYRVQMVKLQSSGGNGADEDLINYSFSTHDLVCLLFCTVIGVWYLLKKHWIANNLLGLAFAVNGVELLALNNVATGVTLLGGLFIYDVFWVFGTDVMVTVARSFEAPIKLVFPQDILENGLAANNFAMLGLGDIVIPGIFIALLLRFDHSRSSGKSHVYFATSFLAYIAGMAATIVVMHVSKHAQPALLYLVPACVGATLGLAVLRRETKLLFQSVF